MEWTYPTKPSCGIGISISLDSQLAYQLAESGLEEKKLVQMITSENQILDTSTPIDYEGLYEYFIAIIFLVNSFREFFFFFFFFLIVGLSFCKHILCLGVWVWDIYCSLCIFVKYGIGYLKNWIWFFTLLKLVYIRLGSKLLIRWFEFFKIKNHLNRRRSF